ncbi:hypothetical protein IF1G_00654 [Cordyceps javanica]|uniref:Uncharacterized protein n=1 Tax=Cordyceps javanica TaxID=43265 RepID=A0A545VG74_9HYPO|nr:hypothetical protein IF1G_00654 [Cordyceps javanica]TQW11904.1 hypothetical protein IF2G_00635 [Cordyceps javanica]
MNDSNGYTDMVHKFTSEPLFLAHSFVCTEYILSISGPVSICFPFRVQSAECIESITGLLDARRSSEPFVKCILQLSESTGWSVASRVVRRVVYAGSLDICRTRSFSPSAPAHPAIRQVIKCPCSGTKSRASIHRIEMSDVRKKKLPSNTDDLVGPTAT